MTRAPIEAGRVAAILLGCALGAAALTSSRAQPGSPAGRGEPEQRVAGAHGDQALILSGDEPDLFLIYSGDVIGYLDPCG